ncbi:MAG TPA: glycosyl hydrolase family 18 protein [Puia sp.]|nr:glycosyl hydrolase family 18 protein [Puia sp.]
MLRICRLVLFFCFLHPVADAQFRVVGYLNTWDHFPGNVSCIPLEKITHLNIAFVQPDAKGGLRVIEGLSEVVKKAHESRVKVLISMGGADLEGTGKNWRKFTDAAHVGMFTDKIVSYVLQNDLDGVDVDLEGNVIGSRYGNFVRTLSEKLKPAGKLVSAAVATWFEEQIPATCFAYLDFVNIMSFDLTGPGDPGHPGQHSPYSMAVGDISFWKKKGLSREKMGLGIPFYGYGFGANSTVDEMAYRDIVARYPGAERKDKVGHTIYYNGMSSITEKARLAVRETSGLMIWQLTGDTTGDKSLLRVVDSVVRKAG